MQKIPTVYQRDPATKLRYVMDARHPDCDWVFTTADVAWTYKWDGTAVKLDELGVWKRREVKPGQIAPEGFRREGDPDPNTGKVVGWVPADLASPEDKWLAEAYMSEEGWQNGTYELVGPKVQGNPHGLDRHQLIRHGEKRFEMGEGIKLLLGDFASLGPWLHGAKEADPGFEGVVFYHPDGRMAKIKVKDFPKPDQP